MHSGNTFLIKKSGTCTQIGKRGKDPKGGVGWEDLKKGELRFCSFLTLNIAYCIISCTPMVFLSAFVFEDC